MANKTIPDFIKEEKDLQNQILEIISKIESFNNIKQYTAYGLARWLNRNFGAIKHLGKERQEEDLASSFREVINEIVPDMHITFVEIYKIPGVWSLDHFVVSECFDSNATPYILCNFYNLTSNGTYCFASSGFSYNKGLSLEGDELKKKVEDDIKVLEKRIELLKGILNFDNKRIFK